MKRSVSVHAALLTVALISAYLVWTRDRTGGDDDSHPMLSMRTLDEVRYDAPERKVHIKKKKDAQGKSYLWIATEKMEKVYPRRQGGKNPFSRFGKHHGRLKGMQKLKAMHGKRLPMPPGAPNKAAATKAPAATAKPGPRATPKAATPVKRGVPKAPQATKKGAGAAKKGTTLNKDPKASPDAAKLKAKTRDKKKVSPVGRAKPARAGKLPAKAPTVPTSAAPKKLPATPKAAANPASNTLATPKLDPKKLRHIKPKPPKKVKKTKQFVGNKAAGELMHKLATLRAIRALGKLGKAKLDEFGLTNSKKKLTLVSGKTTRVFLVGDQTHGNREYYLQDQSDTRVYVVRPRHLEDLRYAEFRLIERNLHAFSSKDYDGVVLKTAKAKRELEQHGRRKPATAFWTEKGSEAKSGKESYRALMTKLGRIKVLDYREPTDKKQLTPIARIGYLDGSRQKGFLELAKEQTLVATPKSKGSAIYYARSEQTRIWAKISPTLGAEVERELEAALKE